MFEAVAFAVCRAVGLETNNAAADYVALYHGDKKMLAESLSVIQEPSAKILNDLLPERITTAHERISELSTPGLKSANVQKGHEVHESNTQEAPPAKQNAIVFERRIFRLMLSRLQRE